MLKLAIFLFAAAAVQAIPTDNTWQRHQHYIQTLADKIRDTNKDVTDLIDKLQLDKNQDQRALLYQANEFAHDVQNIAHQLQEVGQNIEGESKKILQQIFQQLNEIAYFIQQTINSENNEIKNKLKEQVEKLASEAEKLAQHLQHMQKPKRDQDDHTTAIKRVLIDLYVTLKKAECELRNKDKTTYDAYNKLHELAAQFDSFQIVQENDQQTVEDLTDFIQRISKQLNNVNDNFQRKTNDQEGHNKNIMQYVSSRLSDVRRDLEKSTNSEGNTHDKANLLKDQLNRTVRNATTELQRLLQAIQQFDDEGKTAIKHAILEVAAITEAAQAQLKILKKNQN